MKRGAIYGLMAALAVILQACGTLKAPPKQAELYMLTYPAPETVQTGQTLPVRLVVRPLRAEAPYHSEQMVYADNEYRRSAYVYHKWVAQPAEMVGRLIVRDIRSAGIVEAIFPDAGRSPTHILEGTVESFYEDDTADPWEAVLKLTITLEKNTPSQSGSPILLHKTYQVRKTLAQNNPLGLAKAMSQAVQTASQQIISDIRRRLEE